MAPRVLGANREGWQERGLLLPRPESPGKEMLLKAKASRWRLGGSRRTPVLSRPPGFCQCPALTKTTPEPAGQGASSHSLSEADGRGDSAWWVRRTRPEGKLRNRALRLESRAHPPREKTLSEHTVGTGSAAAALRPRCPRTTCESRIVSLVTSLSGTWGLGRKQSCRGTWVWHPPCAAVPFVTLAVIPPKSGTPPTPHLCDERLVV